MKAGHSSFSAKPTKGFIGLWLILMFIWIAANSSASVASLGTGILISGVLACIFTRNTNVWQDVRLSPSGLYHFMRYTGVFAVELVRANMNMMRYVYSPRIDIKPGIIKVKMRLKSPIGRLALANSIALTPGSLVVDIEEEALFVHWLDVQTTDPDQAANMIAEPFEKHLEKVFG